MKRIYVDMDGVLADFYSHPKLGGEKRGYGNYPEMYEPGFFLALPPIKGALEAMDILLKEKNLDIWILTQPVKETSYSYAEKVEWIKKYLPSLEGKIVMTQEKSHLAGRGLTLIDDNPKWGSGWVARGGFFLLFNEEKCPVENWIGITNLLTMPPLLYDRDLRDIQAGLNRLDDMADQELAESMRRDF